MADLEISLFLSFSSTVHTYCYLIFSQYCAVFKVHFGYSSLVLFNHGFSRNLSQNYTESYFINPSVLFSEISVSFSGFIIYLRLVTQFLSSEFLALGNYGGLKWTRTTDLTLIRRAL